jgi:hypothetical protein
MADRKRPKDVASSPGSKVAKEQRMAGTSSGPQEAQDAPRTHKQPPQTSNRRGKAYEHEPTVRKGYEAAENPEAQGDGDPGPAEISERSSVQGHAGRSQGGGAVQADDRVESPHGGAPTGGHAREGRQRVKGDRKPPE